MPLLISPALTGSHVSAYAAQRRGQSLCRALSGRPPREAPRRDLHWWRQLNVDIRSLRCSACRNGRFSGSSIGLAGDGPAGNALDEDGHIARVPGSILAGQHGTYAVA